MSNPLVSIIVASYNAGPFLEAALLSVLNQTYRELEIIVVDDGSTDGSVESALGIRDDRIRFIRQQNRGKPAAVNRALDLIRGEFYALQDADDLSKPERIERQVAAFQRDPMLGAVYTGHELLIDGMACAPRFRYKDTATCKVDIDAFRMPAHDPTGMYRMALVGGMRYSEDLLIGEGLDYILRVGEHFPMEVIGECLYSYRILRNSLTRSNPAQREKFVTEVRKRACARRGLNYEEVFGVSGRHKSGSEQTDNGIATDFMESVVDLRRTGRAWEAILTGLRCAALQPYDLHYYKAFAYSLMPGALRRRIRPSERRISESET